MKNAIEKKNEPHSIEPTAKYLAVGLALALLLSSLWMASLEETDPDCSDLWLSSPLIFVPTAGSVDH